MKNLLKRITKGIAQGLIVLALLQIFLTVALIVLPYALIGFGMSIVTYIIVRKIGSE